jgi:hypothetical protein
MSYVPALIRSIGAILAIVGAAYLATRSYRAQKDANRDAELENQKAESYVRFLIRACLVRVRVKPIWRSLAYAEDLSDSSTRVETLRKLRKLPCKLTPS